MSQILGVYTYACYTASLAAERVPHLSFFCGMPSRHVARAIITAQQLRHHKTSKAVVYFCSATPLRCAKLVALSMTTTNEQNYEQEKSGNERQKKKKKKKSKWHNKWQQNTSKTKTKTVPARYSAREATVYNHVPHQSSRHSQHHQHARGRAPPKQKDKDRKHNILVA